LKQYLLFIFCCFFFLAGFSQHNLRVFAQKEGDHTVLYADNSEVCAVSVQLTLTLENLSADETADRVYLVPANTLRHRLVTLSRTNRRRTGYHYNYSAVFGDARQNLYDRDHVYDLPYRKGTQYRIDQGYNGTFSHQQENALDFQMREGTQVYAARAGLVIAVVQRFNEYCWSDACKEMANYILIYHADGTIATYSHLLFNGARVIIGDSVRKGQLIALSGNTGYTRGPHLHFDCYLPSFEGKRTVMTKFRTGTGKSSGFLKAGAMYKKGY
jgi:murein DD-endopeptidase MepM/ murein hydrolase activator NlpD